MLSELVDFLSLLVTLKWDWWLQNHQHYVRRQAREVEGGSDIYIEDENFPPLRNEKHP